MIDIRQGHENDTTNCIQCTSYFGGTVLPIKKECSRKTCSNEATETFMGEVYCEAHLIVMMRMEE